MPMAVKLPSISLVTCSYQQGNYLEATLRSVLEQRCKQLEYLVIDGGSTDNSVDIIKRHAAQLAYWVSEPDAGQTDALIKGFARCSGDIMGWLCSDDLLLPGALAAVQEYFAQHPNVDALFGDSMWIDAEGCFLRAKKEMPFNRFVFLYDHNYIPQPSMFWRRGLYQRAGGLNREFNVAMDGDLWERFSQRGRIAYLPRYLSCMRYYPQQKTRSLRPQAHLENAVLRNRDARSAALQHGYPLLHLMARITRCALKLRSGGYAAQVPEEHLQWLRRMAVPVHGMGTAAMRME